MSKYAGILRGIQYTDDRNRLAQEREDKLEEMRYNRERQQKLDEMQRKQFEFTMQQAKQEATKAMIPYYAEAWKSGMMQNDPDKLAGIWRDLGLAKMTGLHTIEGVTDADRQQMVKAGVITEGYQGPMNRFVKAMTTSPDGTKRVEYKAADMIAATLFSNYYTEKEQKELLKTLEVQKAGLDVEKSQADIVLAKEKTKTEKAKQKTETSDPTKVLKIIEASQAMKAQEITQKIYNGEQVDTNTPDYNAALKGELSNIKNPKVQEEVDTLNSMTQRVQRATNILSKMQSVEDQSFLEMAQFTLGKMKNLVTSYKAEDFADTTTKTDDPRKMQSYLERIGLESSLAGYLADLIKEQSGAAVNEAEVQRKALELIGGNKYLINKDTMIAAFSTHIEDVKGKIERATTNSLYKNVAPLAYTKMENVLATFNSLNKKKERKPLSSFLNGGN